ncbi:MAG: helix-turn-helix domain-containing protein [Pirellulales bacterium]|nr:helix-turn-helix domain-containing protein [Pirellulales bacterium]
MAQKFYNVAKAAEVLGVSPAEVNELRENQKLHGYRDGADWKFKAEEVDEMASQASNGASDGEEDVLVTELELGVSDPGASGTVIGPPPVELDDIDEDAAAADTELKSEQPKDAVDSAVNGFEELEFTFDDSQLDLASGSTGSSLAGGSTPGSEIDLSAEALDDDDLVLGGSSTSGSDLTLGGDSGISLIDPADSGLSLEEPLDLADGSGDSLALGEDSMLSLDEVSTGGSSSDEAGDSDFTLTPMDEVLDDDGQESDSQVIALDTEEPEELELIDEGMPAMLDEEPAVDLVDVSGAAAPLETAGVADFGAAVVQDTAVPQTQIAGAATVMSEAPYSGLNIASLGFCCVLLALVGMMMYDVMLNMWSWNGVHSFNSPLLSWLSGMLG